jgi:hypothetical protein
LKTKGVCIGGSIAFLTYFTAQVCVVIDDHGGAGVTGDVGAGAGTPNIGVGVAYQTSNADHVRDLNGPFDYVGGSVGPGRDREKARRRSRSLSELREQRAATSRLSRFDTSSR